MELHYFEVDFDFLNFTSLKISILLMLLHKYEVVEFDIN